MSIRTTDTSDYHQLAKVLSRAFVNDPVLRWILPATTDYEKISQPFFKMILTQSLHSGSSFTNKDQTGVSLWEDPDQKHTLISQFISFIRMGWLFRGNMNRAINLQSFLESYRPKKPYWYLTYIATSPDKQGKGIGGSLIKPMIETARRETTAIYLECSNRQNLSFYRAHGFRVVDQISYSNGPTIWPMILDR